MTPKEKAIDILEKINNGKISKALWDNCSDYARRDLQRKAIIVIDEVLLSIKKDSDFTITYNIAKRYWNEVKQEIENLSFA